MIDPLLRHQVYLNRYANGQAREVGYLLSQLARDLREKIAGRTTSYQLAKMKSIEREIQVMVSNLGILNTLNFDELIRYEKDFTTKLLGSVTIAKVSTATIKQIEQLIDENPMFLISGKTVKVLSPVRMVDEFSAIAGRDVLHMIRAGVVEGASTQKIARDVSALVNTRTKSQAEAVTRTLILNAATQARSAVYQANDDILKGEMWVSVLDSRTSIVCAGRDGAMYKIGQGPYPPAHFNCRSVRVPIVKDVYKIPFEGERATVDGPVPGKTTYETWLKGQPETFQNDVLGRTRADLFRKGTVSLDGFVDKRGITYTLDELRGITN